MSLSFVQNPAGIQAVSSSRQKVLAKGLAALAAPVVIDASEGQQRSLNAVAHFIRQGGIWISWGGNPFFYTTSTTHGASSSFLQLCTLLGVPNPSPSEPASFFGPPNGQSRVLFTPTSQPTLPSPWIAGLPAVSTGGVLVWPLIAVPAGQGWWFYLSTDYNTLTAADYAAFIVATAQPTITTQSGTTTPATSAVLPRWAGLAILATTVVVGAGTIALLERRS